MALPSGTDVEYIGQNASGGMVLGQSASELVAFHGATPTDQYAAIESVTASTTLTNVVNRVNDILILLREKGLCA